MDLRYLPLLFVIMDEVLWVGGRGREWIFHNPPFCCGCAIVPQSDEVWLANCQKLMDLTGDLPLGLYETPVPKARNLTPAMVQWIAESGRFNFLKDTSLSISTLLEKTQALKSVQGTPLK